MRCRACAARLTYDDNYCRKCGAAADVIDVEVVQSTPARQVATLRQAAMPVVAQGTAMLVAGALLRFGLRMLLNRQQSAVPDAFRRPFGQGSALANGEIEEILYIRRTKVR